MTRIRRPALVLGTLAVSAVILAGCDGKFTGGGTVPSGYFDEQYGQADTQTAGYQEPIGPKKATFGFVWISKGESLSLAQGSWVDNYVKFRLAGGGISVWTDNGDGCGMGEGKYVSTNNKFPWAGDGYLDICFCDNGEPGVSAGDKVTVDVTSGPYEGYHGGGELTAGNLQVRQVK